MVLKVWEGVLGARKLVGSPGHFNYRNVVSASKLTMAWQYEKSHR